VSFSVVGAFVGNGSTVVVEVDSGSAVVTWGISPDSAVTDSVVIAVLVVSKTFTAGWVFITGSVGVFGTGFSVEFVVFIIIVLKTVVSALLVFTDSEEFLIFTLVVNS